MITIDQVRIRHFHKESESWKRLLEYIQQETTYLRNQLAEVVCEDISNELVADAEEFQNRFIIIDEIIALVRGDICNYNSWLFEQLAQQDRDNEKYYKLQRRLRNEIQLLDQRFSKFKFEFLNYIVDKK